MEDGVSFVGLSPKPLHPWVLLFYYSRILTNCMLDLIWFPMSLNLTSLLHFPSFYLTLFSFWGISFSSLVLSSTVCDLLCGPFFFEDTFFLAQVSNSFFSLSFSMFNCTVVRVSETLDDLTRLLFLVTLAAGGLFPHIVCMAECTRVCDWAAFGGRDLDWGYVL